MSYFHTGTRTIIGAESFHCPVRDGKEWDQLAMVIRLNRWPDQARSDAWPGWAMFDSTITGLAVASELQWGATNSLESILSAFG
jgi:hypothetical protein